MCQIFYKPLVEPMSTCESFYSEYIRRIEFLLWAQNVFLGNILFHAALGKGYLTWPTGSCALWLGHWICLVLTATHLVVGLREAAMFPLNFYYEVFNLIQMSQYLIIAIVFTIFYRYRRRRGIQTDFTENPHLRLG